MLAVTGATAIAVHEWLGLAHLRSTWINFDLIWTAGLIMAGLMLLLSA
jgi:hypothetical protein